MVEVTRVAGADQGIQFFEEGRLAEPVGYANANVALWMSGLLPCVILAGRRGVPAPVRGLLLGGAGILGGAALLGQSRGWLFVLPLAGLVALPFLALIEWALLADVNSGTSIEGSPGILTFVLTLFVVGLPIY